MVLYDQKHQCCGCSGCAVVCKSGAITMQSDDKGFHYPIIEPHRCTNCGLCKRTCAFQQQAPGSSQPIQSYAVKHTDNLVRMKSQSGGAFTALSDEVLLRGGVTYGCALTDSFLAEYRRATTKTERDAFLGSKYIASTIGTAYAQVLKDLQSGSEVLFVGLPCQTAQMRNLAISYDTSKLYLADILCHGAPSPTIWLAHLRAMEQKHHGYATAVDFRNKAVFGWKAHYETFVINGKMYASDVFRKLFFGHWVLRESCFQCPYKCSNRPSDITLGDYWGLVKVLPEWNDDKGVSCVFINSEKGSELFQRVTESGTVETFLVKFEDATQRSLQSNFPFPETYHLFWEEFHKNGFGYVKKKYTSDSLLRTLRNKWRIHAKLRRFNKGQKAMTFLDHTTKAN